MHLELPVFIYLPPPYLGPRTAQLYFYRSAIRRAMCRPWWPTADPKDTPRVYMLGADGDDLKVVPLTPPY
jgi:hypothetical protein